MKSYGVSQCNSVISAVESVLFFACPALPDKAKHRDVRKCREKDGKDEGAKHQRLQDTPLTKLQPKTAAPERVPLKTGQIGQVRKAYEQTAKICARGINRNKSPRIVDEYSQKKSETIQVEKNASARPMNVCKPSKGQKARKIPNAKAPAIRSGVSSSAKDAAKNVQLFLA